MIVAWLCRLNHLNAEHVLLVDSFHSFESDIAYAIVPSNEEKSRTFKIPVIRNTCYSVLCISAVMWPVSIWDKIR